MTKLNIASTAAMLALAAISSQAIAEEQTATSLNKKFYESLRLDGFNSYPGSGTHCSNISNECINYPVHYNLHRTYFDSSSGPLNRYSYICVDGFAFYYHSGDRDQKSQLINTEGKAVDCQPYRPWKEGE